MTDDDFQRLATLYLEDAIDADELRRLNRELADSPERVAQFNDLRLLAGLLGEHGRADKTAAGIIDFREPESSGGRGLSWMSAAALLIAGAVVGVLLVQMLGEPTNNPQEPARRVASIAVEDGSFERTDAGIPIGDPKRAGQWAGDPVAIVSEGGGEIRPADGAAMLRFDGGPAPAPSPRRVTRWQVVDLDALPPDAESAEASLEAQFNRSEDGETGEFPCRVEMYALRGPIATAMEQREAGNFLAASIGNLFADADPRSWESLSTRMRVPPEADFLLLGISGVGVHIDNPFGDSFSGHYADGVRFRLFSEPGNSDPPNDP